MYRHKVETIDLKCFSKKFLPRFLLETIGDELPSRLDAEHNLESEVCTFTFYDSADFAYLPVTEVRGKLYTPEVSEVIESIRNYFKDNGHIIGAGYSSTMINVN